MIIATAGHVDHGKTSLVRNLTGVDTDRLKEEKQRGLSISLGYAYLRSGDEAVLGFIDVPGHRSFINNMIAGISGIDLGMLVVAADDGPMPQTREHLHVMKLLGVDQFVLVISKCDRVDQRRLDTVSNEIAELLPVGTPEFRVSNTTGDGIEDLRAGLESLAKQHRPREVAGHFRMSVDRAFNLQGQGLVLTGTVASGQISVGDSVMLQPNGKELRIRSIYTQNEPSQQAVAGERCAMNVTGDIHKDDINRGDWVVSKSCIDVTSRFDARIHLLPDAPFSLKHLSQLKIHIGAKRTEGRLILLGRDGSAASRINPGDTRLAQLVTDVPVVCCHGDRFLIRDYGETATIGGGVVLDPHGASTGRTSDKRLTWLAAMESEDIAQSIEAVISESAQIVDYPQLLRKWNVTPELRPGEDLGGIARIKTSDSEYWLKQSYWDELQQSTLAKLAEFHRKNPGEAGMSSAQLMHDSLPGHLQHLFLPLISELASSGAVVMRSGLLAAKDHQVTRSAEEDRDIHAILACLAEQGSHIPVVSQLEQDSGIDNRRFNDCLTRAVRDGKLLKINQRRYATPSVLTDFAGAALELTAEGDALKLGEFRDQMGCGRNVVVDVLEYFDAIRFTRRIGDARVVMNRNLPAELFDA